MRIEYQFSLIIIKRINIEFNNKNNILRPIYDIFEIRIKYLEYGTSEIQIKYFL